MHLSQAWPVRVYDCRRLLTTEEKSSGPRSVRGSLSRALLWPARPVGEPSSSPGLLASADRLLAGRPGIAAAGLLRMERGEVLRGEGGEGVEDRDGGDAGALAVPRLALRMVKLAAAAVDEAGEVVMWAPAQALRGVALVTAAKPRPAAPAGQCGWSWCFAALLGADSGSDDRGGDALGVRRWWRWSS